MRVVATQFGILFAVLAFAGKLLAGAGIVNAGLSGVALGAGVLLTLLVTDTIVDRYLGRRYGLPSQSATESPGTGSMPQTNTSATESSGSKAA